jgi:NADH:ubiquinone oxidoreductase subunit 2 (subunit N)
MYMKEGNAEDVAGMNGTRVAILITAILVVLMGIFSGPIFAVVERALI